jgi:hypothetical protein
MEIETNHPEAQADEILALARKIESLTRPFRGTDKRED